MGNNPSSDGGGGDNNNTSTTPTHRNALSSIGRRTGALGLSKNELDKRCRPSG